MGLVKKGCALIGLIVLAFAGWFAYKAFVEPNRSYLDALSEIARLEADEAVQAPFSPPVNGELTADQVERFVAVQTSMMDHLRSIGHAWAERGEQLRDGGGLQGLHRVLSSSPEAARDYLNVKKVQVEALEREGFTASEYAWVRRRVWPALGVDELNVAWSEILDFARERQDEIRIGSLPIPGDLGDRMERAVPEANIRLVAAHEAELRKAVALAALGL